MSILDSKTQTNYHKEGKPMIPLEYVSRLLWSRELGERLKRLRSKVSRRELAEKLKFAGYDCSHQNLQRIEDGDAQTVSVELVLAICEILEASLGQLIPVVRLDFERPQDFTIQNLHY
jgi:transcriptional regulator with XRE-family HTH domain